MKIEDLPFKCIDLDEEDIQILETPLVPEISKSTYGLLIGSCADDGLGVGTLIEVPFSEIIELGRDEIIELGRDEKEELGLYTEMGLYIKVKATEGEEIYSLHDFRIVHY